MKSFSLSILFVFLFCSVSFPAEKRGMRVFPKSSKNLTIYKEYHALVVGIGDYEYLADLRGAEQDAREVSAKLKNMGMKVTLVLNPNSMELKRALNELTYSVGKEENRAILFYFSGHGETELLATGEKMGYIVPKDCPVSANNPIGFSEKAISMNAIESYALRIKSKHVLMVFDSCFSGTVFKSLKSVSADISDKSFRPVRQFITAGSEDEEVPDDSIFKTCFIQGISGEADYNKDGYVTGSELGLYLDMSVVNYSQGAQHPQYGKIRHPKLDKGDFIFSLSSISGIGFEEVAKEQDSFLSVESKITGARVFVDGKKVGETSLFYAKVAPGNRRISVEKEGYDPYRKLIWFENGKSISIYMDLNKADSWKANLYIDTDPKNAEVRILNIRPKFFQGMELVPGKYHVEVSASDYQTRKIWIELNGGEDKDIKIYLLPIAVKTSQQESIRINEYNVEKYGLKKQLERTIKGFLACLHGGKPENISKFACKEISEQFEMALESIRNKKILILFDPMHGVTFQMAAKAVENTKLDFKFFDLEIVEKSVSNVKAIYSTKIAIKVLHPESGLFIPVPDVEEKNAETYFIKEMRRWKVCRAPS